MTNKLPKAYTFQCLSCAALLMDSQINSTMNHDRCPNCGEADELQFIRNTPSREEEA